MKINELAVGMEVSYTDTQLVTVSISFPVFTLEMFGY